MFIWIAVSVIAFFSVRYLLNFLRFRQGIAAVETVGKMMAIEAENSAQFGGPDASQRAFEIALCLKALSDSLTHGKIAFPDIIDKQVGVLNQLLASPATLAQLTHQPVDRAARLHRGLTTAQKYFFDLLRLTGHAY